MARDFVALVGAHEDDASVVLESTGCLLLLGMIIMSLSIISMVIFACIDDDISSIPHKKTVIRTHNRRASHRGGRGAAWGGGSGGAIAGGGCGGGGSGGANAGGGCGGGGSGGANAGGGCGGGGGNTTCG